MDEVALEILVAKERKEEDGEPLYSKSEPLSSPMQR